MSAYPAAPVEPAEVVVLGEALVDIFPRDPRCSLSDEGAVELVRHLGGAEANLAVGLSRQGLSCALISMVGRDALGRFLTTRLRAERVAVDAVGQHPKARTGVCFVSPPARGEGAFLSYRQPSADMLLSPADFSPAHVTRGRVLCLGSSTLIREPARSAGLRALELARAASMLIACDVNFRPHLWDDAREAVPLLRQLIAESDIVKLSSAERISLYGSDDPAVVLTKARRGASKVVALTLGPEGAWVEAPCGQVFIAAENVREVDRTGSGDAFMAGLVAGLLRALGAPSQGKRRGLRDRLASLTLDQLKQAASRGAYLGARAVTALGATTAIPRDEEM